MSAMDCSGCSLGEALERRDFLRRLVAMGAVFVTGIGPRAEKSYPIPAKDGVSIDRGESVIVARHANRLYAFSLACPHQNTVLRWDADNRRFQCPKHKSRYQPDGVFIEGRATRGLDRFSVKRTTDTLVVNLDVLYQENKQPSEWAAAFIPLDSEK